MVTDPERMEARADNPRDPAHQQEDHPGAGHHAEHRGGQARRPALVMLAEDVDGPALQLLVGGNMHKTMQSVVVRAPGFGHRRVAELEDLAVALGRHVIAKDTGIELSEVGIDHLGSCDRITVTENDTTIVGGARATSGCSMPASPSSRPSSSAPRSSRPGQPRTAHRPAHRSGRRHPRRRRDQRRTQGADAARRGRPGRHPGRSRGGDRLRRRHRAGTGAPALDDLDLTGDEAIGCDVVRRALAEPLRWIAINAGFDGDEVVQIVAGPAARPRLQRAHR